ncbi:unnamed protein product [Rhizophagus irregularis]|nr:unnamed protein product [Rhizophagus irregularis]
MLPFSLPYFADHNDFNDIITNPLFGGSIKIKTIDIRSVQIVAGDIIGSIQFTYNVVTDDGISHSYTGNMYGIGGGTNQNLMLADNEKVMSIRGIYGEGFQNILVGQMVIQTTLTSHSYGAGKIAKEIAFTLPVGVIFGRSGDYLDSIGTIQISEVPPVIAKQPIATVTETTSVTMTVKETISPSSISSTLDQNNCASPTSTPLFVCLSFTIAILGLYFVITMGIFLWRKFHRANLANRP